MRKDMQWKDLWSVKDNSGWTPFDLAVSRFSDKARYNMIKDFILVGYDINSKSPENRSALDIAKAEGDSELIGLLLDNGAKATEPAHSK